MASMRATTQQRGRLRPAATAIVCALAVGIAPAAAATTSGAGPTTGSLIGHVSAPTAGNSAMAPVAGIEVAATGPTGAAYSAVSDANGFYELDRLPAPASYAVSFTTSNGATQTRAVAILAGTAAAVDDSLNQSVSTIAGTVTDHGGATLPGMAIGLSPSSSTPCPSGSICGPSTTSNADGTYTLSVVPGSYELEVQDGGHVLDLQAVKPVAGATTTAAVHLARAEVPAGTAAEHAGRDLGWLNAERTRAGLPGGVVLNRRWAQECAAHDAYERANGVLSHTENPEAPGASAGGAWAGLVSVLAQARWMQAQDPWQNAPIHLMQLFTPSLSVIGLDDSGGLQCATTYPGLLRTPVNTETVTTYPADGASGVPPRETAREAPFVPGQFVGIPAGRATGRELFVYLNDSGQIGQAQVKVLRATLSRGAHAVAVRWVDNRTPTVGRYLTGAILIPVKPLRGGSTYEATVAVQDRSGTLTHSWSFTTARR
jgi:Carboxypeptidase regulatory-like domain